MKAVLNFAQSKKQKTVQKELWFIFKQRLLFKRENCFHIIMFHFILFQQIWAKFIYASVVQAFACMALNPILCTCKGHLHVGMQGLHSMPVKGLVIHVTSWCTMIIMIHFKLSSLKYWSKLITGQIIALFGFIQNKAYLGLKQIEIWRPDTEMALTWKNTYWHHKPLKHHLNF